MGPDGAVSAPPHLRYAGAPRATQERIFRKLVLANPVNTAILARMADLPLPQGMLVSGCLYQSVWNGLLGHAPTRGIRDYDLAYFDDSDLSYEAEDRVIRLCAKAFADLGVTVEVRNQARVHVWYETHFGLPYAPLSSAVQSLQRYLCRCHAVAIEPLPGGALALHAPFGLDDVFAFHIRPRDGAEVSADSYAQKAARMQALWPQLQVAPLMNSTKN